MGACVSVHVWVRVWIVSGCVRVYGSVYVEHVCVCVCVSVCCRGGVRVWMRECVLRLELVCVGVCVWVRASVGAFVCVGACLYVSWRMCG